MQEKNKQSLITNPEEIFRDLEGAEIPVPRENAESASFEFTSVDASMPKPLYDAVTPHHILLDLVAQLRPVDFSAKGVKETNGQIKQKHQLVVGCEYINEIAQRNSWAICHNQGLTYVYTGDLWIKLDKDVLEGFLGKAFEQMSIAHVEAAGYIFKANALKQFLSSVYLPTPKRDINCTLVNLKNGTFEIVNGIGHLRPPRQEDFLKYQLPFAYDQEAKSTALGKVSGESIA